MSDQRAGNQRTRHDYWPWNTRAYRWLYKHVIRRIATW